jgi:hypothetical protein
MKAYFLLAPLAAVALAGCTVYRPVAYQPAVVTTPPVAVAPNTVILGAGADPKTLDSDGDGYSDAVDRYPYDARWH